MPRDPVLELMALIHRDGGHYVAEHGLPKALEDAGEMILKERRDLQELASRVQFLVNNWPEPLEDGGITFPDGERWEKSN
jgi:hypothetical protein